MILFRRVSRPFAALVLALSVLVALPSAAAVASDGATALERCRSGQLPARACGFQSVDAVVEGEGVVTSDPAGIACDSTGIHRVRRASACSHSFPFGSPVVLTATPEPGHVFTGWTSTAVGPPPPRAAHRAPVPLCSGSVPVCSLDPLVTDVLVTATFAPIQHRVSVRVEGEGVVTSEPGTIDCAGGVKHRGALPGETCTDLFDDGVALTLSASADDGYQFTGWSAAPPPRNGRRLPAAACSGTDWLCVVPAVHETIDLVATFEPVHVVRVQVEGAGQVTSDPAGILCTSSTPSRQKLKQSCLWDFLDGADVTLTATPDAGHVFVGWADGIIGRPAHRDPAPACTGTDVLCVLDSLGDDAFVRAVFEPASEPVWHTLSVRMSGTGAGVVTSAPGGISCRLNLGGVQDCSQSYVDGAEVTLVASPAAGSTFDGWSGPGCGTATTCTVDLTSSRSVGATFGAVPEDAPDTAISGTPATRSNAHSVFRFGSTTPGATYLCSIDGSTPSACTSPTDYPCLTPGRHVFRVWAVAPGGTVDPSAAQHRFRTTTSRACR